MQTSLANAALQVLRDNDLGGWTKPAPALYAHQWSWDSAFIAIGLAWHDPVRAARELETLFAAQWETGKVPHIVFNPAASGYFPDAARWGTDDAVGAPRGVQTSGLCQPPVHAIAALRVWDAAASDRAAQGILRALYSRLLAWHRYLATDRDPEGSGLVTIYHPWESGTDNSPRWDAAMANVTVGELPPYVRHDATQRPTPEEYHSYLWLLETLKEVRYEERAIHARHPFLVKDVLMTAILVAANRALLELGSRIGAASRDREEIADWIAMGESGLASRCDGPDGLCVDLDVRTDAPLQAATVAGFAPLVAGVGDRDPLLRVLGSEAFLGDPRLRWRVPPSTSPRDPAFRSRAYWRGPTWPVLTWLLAWALRRDGEAARANALREAGLAQLADGAFAEYYEPFTGEPLGSMNQSWTAAVALDWLAE